VRPLFWPAEPWRRAFYRPAFCVALCIVEINSCIKSPRLIYKGVAHLTFFTPACLLSASQPLSSLLCMLLFWCSLPGTQYMQQQEQRGTQSTLIIILGQMIRLIWWRFPLWMSMYPTPYTLINGIARVVRRAGAGRDDEFREVGWVSRKRLNTRRTSFY
jgi:hypothetical protein